MARRATARVTKRKNGEEMKFTLFSAAAMLALTVTAAQAQETTFEITGDAAKGEKVFKKCKACHAVGPDAQAKTGPVLNGILGRTAGTAEEFGYSDVMVQAGADGLVWTPETLAGFLEKPKGYVEGTKMSFAGLRKEADRNDIIAYLASFTAEEEGS